MATYVNDLRLKEIATGDESGTWGTSTNTNLELIGNAMGVGAEAIANASTHTITMADGVADEFRSTFLRLTGGGQACTVTLAPNTLSHTWIMRNETSATLTLTQGSGANVAIAAGQTKIVATDGAGSGAVVYEMDDLELAGNLVIGGDLTIGDDLTITDDLNVGDDINLTSDSSLIKFGADGDTTLTHTDGTGLTLNSTNKLTFGDVASFVQQSSDGVLRVDGEATIDLNASTAVTVSNDLKLDSDSAVLGFGADNDTTLTHTDGSGLTLNSTNKIMFNDASQFIQGSSATVLALGATDEIDLTATLIDINGNADVSGTVTATGTSVFASLDISGDIDVDGTTNLDVVDIDGAVDFASTTAHAGNATFADNAKAIFGAGSDLEIFHEPNNSIIKESGGGSLLIQGDNIRLQKVDGTENMLTAVNDGQLKLFYDGSEKLATTSTGIDVTGTVTADGLTVDGDAQFNTGAGGIAEFFHSSGYGGIKATGAATASGATVYLSNDKSGTPFDIYTIFADGSNDSLQFWSGGNPASGTKRFNAASNGDISFYEDTGTTPKFFWDSSAESLGIGTSSPSEKLTIAGDVQIGESSGGEKLKFVGASSKYNFLVGKQVNVDNALEITPSTAAGGNTFSTPAVVVNSSGTVGIGTSSPATALEVNGTIGIGRTAGGYTFRETVGGGERASLKSNASNELLFNIGAASEAMRIDSSGNVGIGNATVNTFYDTAVNVYGSGNSVIQFQSSNTGTASGDGFAVGVLNGASTDAYIWNRESSNLLFGTGGAERMRIDSSGNVGIATNLPSEKFTVEGVIRANRVGSPTQYGDFAQDNQGGYISTHRPHASLYENFRFLASNNSGSVERMRIDSSGNLLVGGTDIDPGSTGSSANAGTAIGASGYVSVARTGGSAIRAGRIDSNGAIIEFFGDGSAVGKIGTDGSDIYIGSDDTNLLFFQNGFLPANSVGGTRDNASDLGAGSARFKDLYLANVMYSGSARIATTTANSGGKIQVKTFSGGIFQVFQNSSGSTIGYIGNVSNSQTLYAQTSDERLKENITDSADAGSRIDAIQVRQFDWKADGIHQDYGMVAQELQTVAPEVVFEPEDSNDMMGVDYSKLVPMLVKEIQSLRARVQQLENN